MYNQVVVCEGLHDMIKIQSVYKDLKCIITNGSEINEDTIKLILEYAKNYEIILFLDPDYPGERIRSKILSYLPECKNAYIKKDLAISSNHKKVGVEHATKEDIREVLDKVLSKKNVKGVKSININDLYETNIVGNSTLRAFVASKYNIGNPNNKTLLKRLNSLGVSKEELLKIVGEFNA